MNLNNTKLLPILFFALLVGNALAQNLTELDRRNGFKTITLGSPIDSVKGAVFKKDFTERDEFKVKQFETTHGDYQSIGNAAVDKVVLNVYENLVYEIHVYLPKDTRIMTGLEKLYGPSTHSLRLNAYYWKGETLSLIYQGEKNKIHLTYRSGPIIRKMYTDKNKKAEEIIQDF